MLPTVISLGAKWCIISEFQAKFCLAHLVLSFSIVERAKSISVPELKCEGLSNSHCR
jgi:hypothetical protein